MRALRPFRRAHCLARQKGLGDHSAKSRERSPTRADAHDMDRLRQRGREHWCRDCWCMQEGEDRHNSAACEVQRYHSSVSPDSSAWVLTPHEMSQTNTQRRTAPGKP